MDTDFYALFGVEPEAGDGGPAGSETGDDGGEVNETGTSGADTYTDDGATKGGAEGPDKVVSGEGKGDKNTGGEPESNAGPEDESPKGQHEATKPETKPTAKPDAKAIEAAVQAATRSKMDEIIKSMNLVNPRTKQKLQSYADWQAYNEAIQSERRERAMKKLGMSEEQYRELVDSDPAVKKLRDEAQAARESQARAAMADQLRQLHELDPGINEVGDLAKMPNYAQFYKLVKQNRLSLVDAYKLVNMDKLTQRNTAAQVQAARNADAAKAHLASTKQRGGGDPAAGVIVPSETEQLYRELFPDMKPADMRRDYARYLKGNKH